MHIALVRLEKSAKSEPYISFEARELKKYSCVHVDSAGEFINWRFHIAALAGCHIRSPIPQVRLVHSHFGPDAQYGHVIARARSVPHVISVHGYDVCYSPLRYLRLRGLRFATYAVRRKGLLRSAATVLCCSEYLRTRVIQLGVAPETTRVHYLGVDLDSIEAARASSVERPATRGPKIVCVGRLVPIKGQDLLIRALAEIRHVVPNVTLELIGAGPRLKYLNRLARKEKVADIVSFVGALNHISTLQRMSTAEVVVVPSRRLAGVEEAFGLAAAEAMALGVPVVATKTGGLTELLEEGRLGALVPDGDSRLLARAIIDAIQEPSELKIAMAESVIRQRYDAKKQLNKLEQIFDELLQI